ncbi:hypothetical protein OG320_24275 [Microbispora sp. NBC_01189]|uniref:hypothetical protein n=1 Tax=Microbispora sp. NBC_01189 TaxID=2903583 RepID=UPI002E0DC45D|nr:hypothetical protein OG320_24275 [Microbispora sp. NBC_01189]
MESPSRSTADVHGFWSLHVSGSGSRSRSSADWYSAVLRGSGIRPALLVLVLIPVLAGCWCGQVVRREVPVPPASARPEEVVRAYIDALLGKDAETVRAVMVPETDFDDEFNNPNGAFRDWISASDITIDEPYTPNLCPAEEKCRRMIVTMELCEVNSGSYPDGDFAQGFEVRYVKDRWLVTGFGSG